MWRLPHLSSVPIRRIDLSLPRAIEEAVITYRPSKSLLTYRAHINTGDQHRTLPFMEGCFELHLVKLSGELLLGHIEVKDRPGKGQAKPCGRVVAAVREGRVAEAGPPSRSIRRVPKWQDVSCGVWEGAGAARPSATPGRRARPGGAGPSPADYTTQNECRRTIPAAP